MVSTAFVENGVFERVTLWIFIRCSWSNPFCQRCGWDGNTQHLRSIEGDLALCEFVDVSKNNDARNFARWIGIDERKLIRQASDVRCLDIRHRTSDIRQIRKMKFIRTQMDKLKHHFQKDCWQAGEILLRLRSLRYVLVRAQFSNACQGCSRCADAVDLKRLMATVVVPWCRVCCSVFGMLVISILQHSGSASMGEKNWVGVVQVLPIIVVSYAVGLGIEFAFCQHSWTPSEWRFLGFGMLIRS